MFADVGVALRDSNIFRRTIIERHLDTELESRPKRKVRQELKDKSFFFDRINRIYMIFQSC